MADKTLNVTANQLNDVVNKANKDLSNISDNAKAIFDGQWVTTDIELCNQFTADMSLEVDISQYIPNDGYNYELQLTALGSTGTSSGNYLSVFVSTHLMTDSICMFRAITRTSSTMYAGGNGIIAIGTDRRIKIRNTGTATTTGSNYIHIRGYRRLGTNG